MIIASMWLIWMIVWSICYGDSVLLAEVDLPWFAEYQDWLATYGYQECIKKLPDESGKYSCNNFILTLNSENWGWNIKATNKNNNGTKDSWLCQLNSQYHSKFINSQEFQDPYKQIEYCLGVWQDAKRKKVMPRYWYAVRYKRDKWIRFINPPLSAKITEPLHVIASDKVQVSDKSGKLKLTGRKCRQVFTAKEWEVFQLDNKFWQFVSWILGLRQWDKGFVCSK